MSALCRVRPLFASARTFSTKAAFRVHLDAATAEHLQQPDAKHRKHPGIERSAGGSTVRIPAPLVEAIGRALGDHPPKQVWTDSLQLTRYLRSRHAPAEPADVQQRRLDCEREVLEAQSVDKSSTDAGAYGDDSAAERKLFEQRVQKLVAQRTYSWRPLEYDAYRALQYLVGRAPPEYAALVRIFGEIARRRPTFAPHSFFDFGSGVGTGTWAASQQWRQSIFEYYLVDAAREMNDLADLLLRDGDENRPLQLRNVNFRQFMPASTELKYDLVLSAFSLLELPDAKTRLETVSRLWQKCDRFLVIVEQGTRAGFNVVNEARDFVLYSSGADADCNVFAPCAHSQACPRQANAADRTPCNFLAAYNQLPYAGGSAAAIAEVRHEPYSYVVLEKRRDAADSVESAWPRLVRQTLVRSRHTICRMCTADARLEEIIFTARQHGKDAYRCARASRWGDRLPVRLEPADEKEPTVEKVATSIEAPSTTTRSISGSD